jgi:hypothetical protein
VARQYKPISETYGKNRPCLRCFHIRTRTFFNLNDLVTWCYKMEMSLGVAWKSRFDKDKKLKLYWCTKSKAKPRIFRPTDKPFVSNCKLFDGTEIYGE